MQISRIKMEEILDAALEQGGDFAEVFLEVVRSSTLSTEERKMETVQNGSASGAGVRLVEGDRTVYACCGSLDPDDILACARTVSRALTGTPPADPIHLPESGWGEEDAGEDSARQTAMEEKAACLQRADAAAWDVDERLVQVRTVGGDAVQRVMVANSRGEWTEDLRSRTRFVTQAVARNDAGVIQSAYEAVGGLDPDGALWETELGELARAAASRAVRMLEARPAPAGRMPVVVASEAGGTMIHEACGHGLEADLVRKELSVYAGQKGREVASPLVSVIDDGTLPGRYGTSRTDDEGVPCQRNVLIDRGVLRVFLQDRTNARCMEEEPTGNGRRESFRHKPIPRMTNTMIAPGQDAPEEILRDTPQGLYVRKMGGGQVNPANGDFVFEVSEGYLIENGEVGAPVRGATLTGNGPEVLRTIDRVGHDLGFAVGTCGKDGQGVPVADAQPTIRIPELVVGGIMEGPGEEDD